MNKRNSYCSSFCSSFCSPNCSLILFIEKVPILLTHSSHSSYSPKRFPKLFIEKVYSICFTNLLNNVLYEKAHHSVPRKGSLILLHHHHPSSSYCFIIILLHHHPSSSRTPLCFIILRTIMLPTKIVNYQVKQ